MENPTQISTAAIAGHLQLLGHQKLDIIIFQQSEHSVNLYKFTSSIDPASAAKQSDFL